MTTPDFPLLLAFVSVFGLAVGSFLNVVIYRLPLIIQRQWDDEADEAAGRVVDRGPRMTLSSPRSSCPKCGAAIRPWQNIPVISWLLLRGRCASCSSPIAARYPAIELLTALGFALLAWRLGWGWALPAALVFAAVLIAAATIDLDTTLLLDDLTLPLLWLGLLVNAFVGFVPLKDAVLGAAAGYGSLWLLFHGYRLLTGQEAMGYGDFKLLAAIGAWVGWKSLAFVLLASFASGALVGIVLILAGKRDRASKIPFGPYLAAGGYIALLLGPAGAAAILRIA